MSSRVLVVCAAALALAACNDRKEPTASESRSNAVLAKDAGAAPAQPTAPAATTAAVKAPRKLCEPAAAQKAPRDVKVEMRSLFGATPPPASIPFGAGKYVWVNLWAAWCGPCKEEIPRIERFRDKLRASGVLVDVAFVSLDDDERQLRRFLDAQPTTGLRASYWLPEGPTRDHFLGALGLKDGAELPQHVIYGPSGQVACAIHGAVEDGDYPVLAAVFGAH